MAPVFNELVREADRLFEGALAYPSSDWASNAGDAVAAADIYETKDELVLKMDLPGHDPSTVNIKVEGDVLTVQANRPEPQLGKGSWLRQERSQGQVARTFVLPNAIDGSRCEASYHHGVLVLTMPKREEAKPRNITVKVQT